MDLDKLAKLSCLDIKDEDKNYFSDSLADVMLMMDKIAGLEVKTTNDNLTQCVTFNSLDDKDITDSIYEKEKIFIDRDNKYSGIHLEQGVFLAPKVIKKD